MALFHAHDLFFSSLKFSQYFVTPQKQLDVGNYAFALLFSVRLVLQKFQRLKVYLSFRSASFGETEKAERKEDKQR